MEINYVFCLEHSDARTRSLQQMLPLARTNIAIQSACSGSYAYMQNRGRYNIVQIYTSQRKSRNYTRPDILLGGEFLCP